jgi:short-subunit dehydrogenase
MKEQGSGYIINVSSTVALGVAGHLSTYGISKCGLVGMSQALHETAKQYGVKVSTVYPGMTDTKMVRDVRGSANTTRWMLPEDIAYCMIFLLKSSERMVVKDIVPVNFQLG